MARAGPRSVCLRPRCTLAVCLPVGNDEKIQPAEGKRERYTKKGGGRERERGRGVGGEREREKKLKGQIQISPASVWQRM